MTEEFGLLRLPSQILVGAGQRRALGEVVVGLGRSALICTDARMATTGDFAELVAAVEARGVRVAVFADVRPELPVASVEACVRGAGRALPEVIVGVGGGSCIDHAKVTALLLSHGGTPSDYFGEFRVPGPCRPVVAVPTTAGTGSEVTPVAVLNDPGHEMKIGISSPHLIPRAAIVDPELTYSCPPRLTADAAADALSHCVEAFTAVRRSPTAALSTERVFVGKSQLTDTYALAGVALIDRALPALIADPGDRPSRADLMLAALYGGLALATAGTAAAHALQYPIGAITHTSHGLGVGTLLPYVMQFNLPARVEEFAAIARALGIVADDPAQAAVDRLAGLLADAGIPTDLRGLGLGRHDLDRVARLGMNAARLVQNNPRRLDVATMRLIVTAAFEGDRDAVRE